MNIKILYLLILVHGIVITCFAQFAPPAGQTGSTAIHKESSLFVGWATGCSVVRGLRDISIPDSGYAEVGDSTMALGKSGSGVVSLGDGGWALLTFAGPITNGAAWDFAVFENSFSDDFLELAFVEVSSDGINFFRFPATSLIQDSIQVDGFGPTDATKINNLAGKYRAQYGTPFDLEELKDEQGLDVNSITHIKIIDVVGSINDAYATYDQYGNKVNDPFPTPFPSGGFDLDAVGVIHQLEETSVYESFAEQIQVEVFPNPIQSNSIVRFNSASTSPTKISVLDFTGRELSQFENGNSGFGLNGIRLPEMSLPPGIYFIRVESENAMGMEKIIVTS